MITVTYRDQKWEVPGHQTVREVIQQVGMDPATVLAVRKGKLVFDSEMLGSDDDLKLIAVISGGWGQFRERPHSRRKTNEPQ